MNDDSLPPVALLEHAGFVRSLASNLLRDDAEADDAAQETLARALERPPRAGPGVRGWLAAVLRNVVRMRKRSGARRFQRERAAARGEATRAADDAAARQEVLRAVVAAVRCLDAQHREVVMLRHYEELPPRAIAARLGLPVATVKGRLRRAHERLRERLDERRGGNVEGWRTALCGLVGFEGIARNAATVGGGVGGVAMGTGTKVGVAVTTAAPCRSARRTQAPAGSMPPITSTTASGLDRNSSSISSVHMTDEETQSARLRATPRLKICVSWMRSASSGRSLKMRATDPPTVPKPRSATRSGFVFILRFSKASIGLGH